MTKMGFAWKFFLLVMITVCYTFLATATMSLMDQPSTLLFIVGLAAFLVETIAALQIGINVITYKRKETKNEDATKQAV